MSLRDRLRQYIALLGRSRPHTRRRWAEHMEVADSAGEDKPTRDRERANVLHIDDYRRMRSSGAIGGPSVVSWASDRHGAQMPRGDGASFIH